MVAEVARRKALAAVLEKANIVDTAGTTIDLNELNISGEALGYDEGADHEGADLEVHDHEGADLEVHDHEGVDLEVHDHEGVDLEVHDHEGADLEGTDPA
jgi:trigger factor